MYTHYSNVVLQTLAGPLATASRDLTAHCFLASLLDQLYKERGASPGIQTSQASSHETITLLLVDDDCDDRDLFAEAIYEIHSDIKVKMVTDGFQLMKYLDEMGESMPAVIFLDLNMPGKSGKDCLAEIKNNARLKHIPVIIYSTSSHKKDIEGTHAMGANLYICKPNSFKGLISVITQALSRQVDQLTSSPSMELFVLLPDQSKEQ